MCGTVGVVVIDEVEEFWDLCLSREGVSDQMLGGVV